MNLIFTTFLGLALVSCAGYRLGGAKPPSLSATESISVSMFESGVPHPRAESIATSAVADALVRDGTYRLADSRTADGILEGKVASIDYGTLRTSRLDSRLAEELTNTVRLEWVLKDAKNTTRILASGSSDGRSSFFVDSNLQTARQNALPDAFERAATSVVSRLASGY